MTSQKLAEELRLLRAMIARGRTLAEAGRALGRSKSTAGRLAQRAGLKPSGKLHPHKERQIQRRLAREEAISVIARLVGVSKATVHRRKQQRMARPTVATYRCPGCGHRVIYRPCLICARRPGKSKRARSG